MSTDRRPFITDVGINVRASGENETFELDRYAAWVWDTSKHKHQVVETSNDLEHLQRKYAVAADRVLPLRVQGDDGAAAG